MTSVRSPVRRSVVVVKRSSASSERPTRSRLPAIGRSRGRGRRRRRRPAAAAGGRARGRRGVRPRTTGRARDRAHQRVRRARGAQRPHAPATRRGPRPRRPRARPGPRSRRRPRRPGRARRRRRCAARASPARCRPSAARAAACVPPRRRRIASRTFVSSLRRRRGRPRTAPAPHGTRRPPTRQIARCDLRDRAPPRSRVACRPAAPGASTAAATQHERRVLDRRLPVHAREPHRATVSRTV